MVCNVPGMACMVCRSSIGRMLPKEDFAISNFFEKAEIKRLGIVD